MNIVTSASLVLGLEVAWYVCGRYLLRILVIAKVEADEPDLCQQQAGGSSWSETPGEFRVLVVSATAAILGIGMLVTVSLYSFIF